MLNGTMTLASQWDLPAVEPLTTNHNSLLLLELPVLYMFPLKIIHLQVAGYACHYLASYLNYYKYKVEQQQLINERPKVVV